MNSDKKVELIYSDGYSVIYSLGSLIKHTRHNGERPIKAVFNFKEVDATPREMANINATINYLDVKKGVVEFKG